MKKIIVGLTGGFATGKSTARMLFQTFGAKTFDCDAVAHEALKKKTPTYRKIVRTFGEGILLPNGQINRQELGNSVFGNKQKKKKLEAIIHPFVRKKTEAFIRKHKGLLVVEVPLLFEAKFEQKFDFTVVIYCNQLESIKRAKKSFPHLTKTAIKRRIQNQMPLSKKKKKADYAVCNHNRKNFVKQISELTRIFKEKLKR